MPIQADRRCAPTNQPGKRSAFHRPGPAAVALICAAATTLLAGCGSSLPLSTQRQMEGGGLAGAAGGTGANSTGSATAGGLGGSGSSSLASGTGGSTTAGSGTGTAGSGPAGTGTGTGSGSGSAGAAGAGTSASGASGAGTAGGSSASSAVGGGSSTVNGPGVTASTIYVADYYDPNAQTEDTALGAGGLNPGDTQAESNAVAAYINAHGGVAHRKLAIVWASVNSADNIQQQEQAACNTWTVDNKVFVMPDGVPVWDQCIASAHALGVTAGDIAQETTPIMRQYPADFNLTGMTLDRAERYTIEGVQRQGYFAKGAKVGIVTWDGSDYQYAAHLATTELTQMGFPNVPVEYVSEPQTYGDVSTSSSDVSSAILKFRSAGVDHVLLFDGTAGVFSGAGLTLLFMNAANSQDYHPEYGLNTTSGLSTTVPDVPASEIQNSMAIGWIPSLDLDSADYSALPQSAQAKVCLQIMAAAGQAPSGANAEANAFQICDRYFFVQEALDHISGSIDQATAIAAIQALGTSFPVITVFEDDFTASQHDGVELVRNATYNGSCTCFRYSSPTYNPG